jgi:MurNAc alpha-1-phosphate uridylyltransferase
MSVGETAMVLAAGYGQRMRPLTLTRPKPLIEVAGKSLIDYGMAHLRAAGVARAVVNVHYLPEQIEAWAAHQKNPAVTISDERGEILDTGGGIARGLPLLGEDPFFVLNSDSFWVDEGEPALDRLRAAWDDTCMDCLLLLSPLDRTVGYDGKGDFLLGDDGRLARRNSGEGAPLAYIGGYLVAPRLFDGAPTGKFSMNLLWDKAIGQGRLFGIAHKGRWLHVGTPEAIPLAEAALKA